jgi:aspartate kinase
MIICKFGGTSVQDAEAMERVAAILSQCIDQRPVVVASAMGKTTNGLLHAARLAADGKRQDALEVLSGLRNLHISEAQKLGLAASGDEVHETITSHFKEMANIVRGLATLGELTPRSMDAMASYGERLSTLILCQCLMNRGVPAELMDSRRFIVTDDNFTRAAPLFDLTDAAIRDHLLPAINSGKVPVVQGFVGSTKSGITSTIGRGGSDYTASIVGAAL